MASALRHQLKATRLASPVLGPWCGAGAVRGLHKGHLGATLEKLYLPRHQWLKEVDQAPEASTIRQHKDRYLKELGLVHADIQGLFRNDETASKAVTEFTQEEQRALADSKLKREDANEAMRMYRLLRPDADPFYEEDSMQAMQAKANRILRDELGEGSALTLKEKGLADPFKAYLPVVNPRAFLLALESVVASLAEDVETMCLLVGLDEDSLPEANDPLRFKHLLDRLFDAFPLSKDPSRVSDFMENHWPRLRLLLPKEVAELPEREVGDWLAGHLQRVRLNQRRAAPKIFLHTGRSPADEELYSFAEDFLYDYDPVPGDLADERNLDFPLEQAAAHLRALLGAVGQSATAARWSDVLNGDGEEPGAATEDVAEQFQELVWDLEKIGLRNWLKMDLRELERFLPKGEVAQFALATTGGEPREGIIELRPEDVRCAKLMLRCAARGHANLLDFDAVDPQRLLHGFPGKEVEEELAELPPHMYLGDGELEALVEECCKRLDKRGGALPTDEKWLSEGANVAELYRRELEFYRSSGPLEWQEDEDGKNTWKWQQPPNTFWDGRRKVYIQYQKGVNPNLELKEMRQHMLDITRMGSMVKVGRINFFRAIIVVGNGRGVYGFGVGFGNSGKEARADACLKALQNLDYIDMDPGRMLCTPCKGMEYKTSCTIIPRPIGRGIRANKKFLPLLYILGLDNVKVKFMHLKWFTRIRCIKRALDMMISRRTLANMTGKRYPLVVAPGDHWVHWPDRWFNEVRAPYDRNAQYTRLLRRHALHFKSRGNTVAVQRELKPGWRKENWARWNNPLERWLQSRRAPRVGAAPRDAAPGPVAHDRAG